MMKETVTDYPAPRWKRIICQRKTGKTAGKFDVYFVNPDGKRLRSRPEVAKYLKKNGLNLSLELFCFKVGSVTDVRGFTKEKERTGVEQGCESSIVKSLYFIDAQAEDRDVPEKSTCCVEKVTTGNNLQ